MTNGISFCIIGVSPSNTNLYPPLKVSFTKSNLWGASKYPREQPVSCSSTNSAYQTNSPQIAADSSETSNPDSIM